MSRTLQVSDAVYARLEETAAASGTTPEGWIAAHLPEADTPATRDVDSSAPRNLAELLGGLIGTVASDGNQRLSESTAEDFADYLEAKRRAGRL